MATALITGAAQRIGKALTQTFHTLGYDIALHYNSSSSEALALQKELELRRSNSVTCYQADLTDRISLDKFISQIKEGAPELKVIINNASAFSPNIPDEISDGCWETLINSNLKAPYFIASKLSHLLAHNNGCIINMIDIHSERPMPGYSGYSIAKAGLAMATKALAKELAPNVRVNGIAPGAILWPEAEIDDKEKQQSILSKIPLARAGEESDICKTARFLAEDAPYITGQIIAVDGGRSLNL